MDSNIPGVYSKISHSSNNNNSIKNEISNAVSKYNEDINAKLEGLKTKVDNLDHDINMVVDIKKQLTDTIFQISQIFHRLEKLENSYIPPVEEPLGNEFIKSWVGGVT